MIFDTIHIFISVRNAQGNIPIEDTKKEVSVCDTPILADRLSIIRDSSTPDNLIADIWCGATGLTLESSRLRVGEDTNN